MTPRQEAAQYLQEGNGAERFWVAVMAHEAVG
jgi:hypothetical protein